MKPRVSYPKFLFSSVLAAVLGTLMAFVSAPLLRVLFNTGGSRWYWLHGLILSVGLGAILQSPVAGFMLFSTWMVIGLYGELESRGHAGRAASFLAIIAGVIVGVVGPFLWMKFSGQDLLSEIKFAFESYLNEMKKGGSIEKSILIEGFNVDILVRMIPGILFVMHVMSLATALVFDRRFAFFAQFRFERYASEMKLLDFRLPDVSIWIAIVAFLLSFWDIGWPSLQITAVNVCIGLASLYFLQGLAILEVFFAIYRIGFILRLFAYLFLVGQLFPILIALGFIDYWLDLRTRMRKSRTSETGSNSGEQI